MASSTPDVNSAPSPFTWLFWLLVFCVPLYILDQKLHWVSTEQVGRGLGYVFGYLVVGFFEGLGIVFHAVTGT